MLRLVANRSSLGGEAVPPPPLWGRVGRGVKYLGLFVGEALLPPSARQEASVLPHKGGAGEQPKKV